MNAQADDSLPGSAPLSTTDALPSLSAVHLKGKGIKARTIFKAVVIAFGMAAIALVAVST